MTTVTSRIETAVPIAPKPLENKGRTKAPTACTSDLCYLFVTQKNVFSRNEMPEEKCEGALIVFVLYCSATRRIFAHAVPKKGFDSQGYIVELIRDDVIWLGHPKVMIRSDNEHALLQVVDTALAALKATGVTSSSVGSVPSSLKPTERPRSPFSF